MKEFLYTPRLILRPWRIEDAEALYEYAKDPRVGPNAGWEPHKSIEESIGVIKTVLTVTINYAVCIKPEGDGDVDPYSLKPVGSIELLLPHQGNEDLREGEAEICYWIGVPFWGHHYIPEAVLEIQRYAFEEMNIKTLWCGYFKGNLKSRNVIELCGFTYGYTMRGERWEATHSVHTEYDYRLTREEWEKKRAAEVSAVETGYSPVVAPAQE